MAFQNAFTSDRLLFEPLDPKDEQTKAFLYEYTIRDPEVLGYASNYTFMPVTRTTCDDWVASFEKNLISVIISLKPYGELRPKDGKKSLRGIPIGYMAIFPIQMRTLHHRTGELGISIASANHGKGYGTEALQWLANWAFQFGNLHSLRLHTSSMNEKALGAYKKAGFIYEGREREVYYSNGKWHDKISMSILEHEWQEREKKTVGRHESEE